MSAIVHCKSVVMITTIVVTVTINFDHYMLVRICSELFTTLSSLKNFSTDYEIRFKGLTIIKYETISLCNVFNDNNCKRSCCKC